MTFASVKREFNNQLQSPPLYYASENGRWWDHFDTWVEEIRNLGMWLKRAEDAGRSGDDPIDDIWDAMWPDETKAEPTQ